MKTKITKRMASSITTTTSNPINKKYLEYCEDIKASFKQCTYYMKRKKKTCTRRVNDFNTQFCSLHTPEGLARERKKGEETRKVYNKLVDKTCEEYLKELVRMVLKHNSNVNNNNNSVTNESCKSTIKFEKFPGMKCKFDIFLFTFFSFAAITKSFRISQPIK